MTEKIFWGIASLLNKDYDKYLVMEKQNISSLEFSFVLHEENLFIRSNFSDPKEIVRFLNLQKDINQKHHDSFYKIEVLSNKNSIEFHSDAFGIHSLYWAEVNDSIIFSNSSYFLAKLLGKSPLGIRGLFIHLILRGQINSASYFEDIFQMPPQSILRLGKSGITISKGKANTSPDASIGKILLKDIPDDIIDNSGISFSGGIDSSIIVKECLNRHKTISCYSLVNPNNRNLKTDLYFADMLASQQYFNINKVPFQIDNEIFYYDMPVLDHDVYGQICLAKAMVQDGKKYMICGSGADELFGGYDRIFYYANEISHKHCENPVDYILQRYSYTDFKLLQYIDGDLFGDVYHNIKTYYANITTLQSNLVSQLHQWFIYHHLFWILKMHPSNISCIFPYLREEFLSFCLQTDYNTIFPYLLLKQTDPSYHSKVKSIIKEQYKYSLPPEILKRPKLPFSVQEKEIDQWYEAQYVKKQPDCLVPADICEKIMAGKYGTQTKLLFLSYILWRQRVS